MSFNKKKQKKNSGKLELLKKLTDIIKGSDEKHLDINEIAEKYNIEINFSDTLLEEVHLNKMPNEGQMTERDEVDDYIISMDGDTAVELDDADENPKTLPPNSNIAASKLNLVLVLGSKNKVANFLCLHFSEYFSGNCIISFATFINSSISSTVNSFISIKCLILASQIINFVKLYNKLIVFSTFFVIFYKFFQKFL